jgi:ketosteroid isomerase-like protein
MKLHMLGDVAVLVHSIHMRQRTDEGEETAHERETIVFAKQSDGRWLVVHQHLSPPNRTESSRPSMDSF